MSSLIVYVDGFNLYHGLKAQFGRRMLWLDLVALANRLRPKSRLIQVRYFTAPVLDHPEAASRQSRYQQALLAQNPGLIEIVQGRYQKKPMNCRKCGAVWTHYEEKETDVNIATSLVADSARRRSESALIVSADSDLTPAVKAARSLYSDLYVVAAFPPKRFSAELKKLMPGSFQIGHSKIRQSQLPPIVGGGGRSYSRPDKWAN